MNLGNSKLDKNEAKEIMNELISPQSPQLTIEHVRLLRKIKNNPFDIIKNKKR